MKLVVIVQPTYQGLTRQFSAYSPDIPGCVARGSTEDKALAMLERMITHQIHTLEKMGMEHPQHFCKVAILDIQTNQSLPDEDVLATLPSARFINNPHNLG